MAETYDIIFYGGEIRSDQLGEIKARVANILRLNDQKLETLFSRKDGVVLKHGVSLEGAKKTKKILIDAGVLCNYKVSERKGRPAVKKEKYENSLKRRYQGQASKRAQLIVAGALAAAIAGSLGIVQNSWFPRAVSDRVLSDSAQPGEISAVRQQIGEADSGTASSREFKHVSSEQTIKQIAGIKTPLSESPLRGAKNTRIPERTLFPFEKTAKMADEILSEIAHDKEWDISLVAVVRALLESERLDHAYKIAGHIADDTLRFRTLGDVAYRYTRQGRHESASAKLKSIKKDISVVPNRAKRTAMLCELAWAQQKTGESGLAQHTLMEAQTLTESIQSPLHHAISLGHVGAVQTELNASNIAESSFQEANAVMATVPKLTDRLAGYIQLASSYARSGDKNGTLNILHAALKSAKKFPDQASRSSLLADISLIRAQTGSHTDALDVARVIESTMVRDKTIYRLVTEQVASGDLHAAMASAEQLEQPLYEAKAYALLARFQKGSPLDLLVNDNFEHAIDSALTLSDPVIQGIMLSEIARYYMRAEEDATARNIMRTALQLAQQAERARTKDIALAAIARNQALASLLTQADRTAELIDDRRIKANLFKDINRIRRAIYALKVVQAPLNV